MSCNNNRLHLGKPVKSPQGWISIPIYRNERHDPVAFRCDDDVQLKEKSEEMHKEITKLFTESDIFSQLHHGETSVEPDK